MVLVCWKAGILQLITMNKVYPLHGTYGRVIHWLNYFLCLIFVIVQHRRKFLMAKFSRTTVYYIDKEQSTDILHKLQRYTNCNTAANSVGKQM